MIVVLPNDFVYGNSVLPLFYLDDSMGEVSNQFID